jgi:hypothetical protein
MSVCLYSHLNYLACKAHLSYAALCCYEWPDCFDHIFQHYLMNDTTFGKICTEHKMCAVNLSTTFHIIRRIQQDIIINVHRSSCKVHITLVKFQSNLNLHQLHNNGKMEMAIHEWLKSQILLRKKF